MDKKTLTIIFIIVMFLIMGAEIYFGIIKKNQPVSAPAGTPPSAASGTVGGTSAGPNQFPALLPGQGTNQTSPLSGTGYQAAPSATNGSTGFPSLLPNKKSTSLPTPPKPPAGYKLKTGTTTVTPKVNIIIPTK